MKEGALFLRSSSAVHHFFSKVSCLIPLAETDEGQIISFLEQMLAVRDSIEILVLADSHASPPSFNIVAKRFRFLHWVPTNTFRAQKINQGIKVSKREFLWVLHVDSLLPKNWHQKLPLYISSEESLSIFYYFKLGFQKDGPLLTKLNEWGVSLRDQYLQLPFGDQGFFMNRKILEEIGTFNENYRKGEDLEWILRAKQSGNIQFEKIPLTLQTSARKYQKKGWGPTTLEHILYTAKEVYLHHKNKRP